jgi:hypothetical protein
MADKQTIIAALDKWLRQRPGLEFGNYGDVSSYRSEMRSIGRDLQHARAMVNYVAWHDSITAEMIVDAAKHSYSGRLSIAIDGDKVTIDYVTGQYWPTEYRRAVCALMSSVIWSWLRENAPPDAGTHDKFSNLQDVGDYIRKTAKREFGASIARRWFK